MASKIFRALTRKKTIDGAENNKLDRVLNLVDLTALGVGTTLGLGVYVLAGSVAKTVAGPAICLSFLIAAVASAVAGLCYAEFAARVPKAGSAYVYSYVSVGEFIAFTIGWNLILEYVIGTASVARGVTSYLDSLLGHKIEKDLTEWMPINVSYFSKYPDFVSFLFVMLLTVLLSIGVKESTRLNNLFTALNLTTIVIVLVAGAIKADPANWKLTDVPSGAGDGGFIPFGISGVMAGAAKCFYGFVGFDSVATTGEEAKNPQKDIPLAIVISLVIVFLAYFGISTVLTMVCPYYDQDADAPLPHMFDLLGWTVLKWIVTIGAVFALFTSLLGAMFPLPRILYAMSDDGIIFKVFAKIHPRFKTPLIATIISGLFAGAMATMFDLEQLIEMMSIGTLLAYTIVAVCVLILRYEPADKETEAYHRSLEMKSDGKVDLFGLFKDLFNLNMNKYASQNSSLISKWSITLFSIFAAGFSAIIVFAVELIRPEEPLYFILFLIVTSGLCLTFVVIARQPVDDIKLTFKVPWVPLIPCLSIIINTYLMLELDVNTWIRFVVWLLIGFMIYFCYGIFHSKEGLMDKQQVEFPISNGVKSIATYKETTKI